MRKSGLGNQTWEFIVHLNFAFLFNRLYGKAEKKPNAGWEDCSVYVLWNLSHSSTFTLSISSCSHLLFLSMQNILLNIWNLEAGKLNGKRLFKGNVSLCLCSAFTLVVFCGSEELQLLLVLGILTLHINCQENNQNLYHMYFSQMILERQC